MIYIKNKYLYFIGVSFLVITFITMIWPKHDLVFSIQRPEDNRFDEFYKILKEEILDKIK